MHKQICEGFTARRIVSSIHPRTYTKVEVFIDEHTYKLELLPLEWAIETIESPNSKTRRHVDNLTPFNRKWCWIHDTNSAKILRCRPSLAHKKRDSWVALKCERARIQWPHRWCGSERDFSASLKIGPTNSIELFNNFSFFLERSFSSKARQFCISPARRHISPNVNAIRLPQQA